MSLSAKRSRYFVKVKPPIREHKTSEQHATAEIPLHTTKDFYELKPGKA
jgi:hypothetical protein